jgi:hypothetical protein
MTHKLFEGYTKEELSKLAEFFAKMAEILCQLPENEEIAKKQKKLREP